MLKRLLGIALLALGISVPVQAQTYTGTLYPSSTNGMVCTPLACTFTAPIIGSSTLAMTGKITVPNSPNSTLAGSSVSSPGVGMYMSTDMIGFTNSSNALMWLAATSYSGTQILSTHQYGWSASAVGAGGNDTGLAREAAALSIATNGAAGFGKLLHGRHVFANTTTLGLQDRLAEDIIVTNTGDSDGSIVNLPDNPSAGASVMCVVTATQTLTINAASGETIKDGTSSGTSIVADAIGEHIYLVAVVGGSGGYWMVLGKAGTWTLS